MGSRRSIDCPDALRRDDGVTRIYPLSDALERSRRQHAISVHQDDVRPYGGFLEIEDALGKCKREGNAISCLTGPRKKFIHQDKADSDTGHGILEPRTRLHIG